MGDVGGGADQDELFPHAHLGITAGHVHGDFAVGGLGQAPPVGGVGGGGGAGAARLGDAGAALVHPHGDGVAGGTGGHHLQVHVRHLGAEGGEIDVVHVVDGHDSVRVPEREVGDGTARIAPEGVPAGGRPDKAGG